MTPGRHRKQEPLPKTPGLVLGSAFLMLATAPTAAPGLAQWVPRRVEPPKLVAQPVVESPGLRAVRAALSKVGTPYVWGAKGPDRFDCSGLTQWAWKQAGYKIGEDTYRQINEGRPVTDVQPGDLLFPWRGHVLMAISPTEAVEAPARGLTVRVRPLPDKFIARRIA